MIIFGSKPSITKSGLTVILADYLKTSDANFLTQTAADTLYQPLGTVPEHSHDGYLTAADANTLFQPIITTGTLDASVLSGLATVATSGSYNDLTDKPDIPSTITEDDVTGWGFTKNEGTVTTVKIGSTPYTASGGTIYLPSYPAAVTSATVSGWGFTKNEGTYSKPDGGIPKSDLASAVQTSLGLADSALQSHPSIDYDRDIPISTTLAHSDTFTAITALTKDTNGHLTGITTTTYTLPATPADNDKKTSSANKTGSKQYLVTATSQSSNGVTTYSNSGCYVGTDNKLYSDSKVVLTEHQSLDGKQDKITDANKLSVSLIDGIPTSYAPTNAQKNVQSDWNETDTTSDAYIQNKPSIPAEVTESTVSGWGFTKYTHPNSGVTAGTYRSVTVNTSGHVTAGTNPTTIADYGITDAKIDNGVITLGSNTITPLTSHQSLSNYYTKTQVDGLVGSVYRVKGTKTYAQIIALTDAKVGDVYNASDNGANYVCITANTAGASSWDKLSETVDLSGYALKTEIPTIPGLSKGTTTGTGNAVTDISVNGHTITLTKGTTFLTEHQSLGEYVKGPASATADHIATFTDGKTIKDSGFTIATSVPANAKFTDTNTTYSAGSGLTMSGTTLSETYPLFYAKPNETTQTATLTVTIANFPSTYANGQMIALYMPFANLANTTLNVNGLGAKPVYYGKNTTSGSRVAPEKCTPILVYSTNVVSTGSWNAVYAYDSNTTYNTFLKHTSEGAGGRNGLVPVPSYTTTSTRYLREDGTWQVPPDTNTTYTLASLGAAPSSHAHGNIANDGTVGTASRVLISDGDKKVTVSSVTTTTLGYLDATSSIQTQLNGKAASSHNQAASTITAGTLGGKVLANATAAATVTDSQVRNITISTSTPSGGNNGDIWIVY